MQRDPADPTPDPAACADTPGGTPADAQGDVHGAVPRTGRRGALARLGLGGAAGVGSGWAPLAAMLGTALAGTGARAAGLPLDVVTVLYRRESPQAPTRLDPAVQAATLALEDELLKGGLRVVQPSAEAYRVMDEGQAVVVTFAADAGLALVYSAYRDLRPTPGVPAGIAEVRLQARIHVGRAVLAAETGRGQMHTRLDPTVREFGERRAMELAAGRAAAELAERLLRRVAALTPERVQAMIAAAGETVASSSAVALPAEPVRPPPPPPPPAPPPPPPQPPPAAPAPSAAPLPPAAPPAEPTLPAAPPYPPPPANGGSDPEADEQANLRRGKRYALLVGVSDYEPVRRRLGIKVGDLKGVARDLPNVGRALLELGFAADNIYTLQDDKATSVNVRTVLKQLARKAQPEDVFVLFMSAHGVSKEGSYSGWGMPVLNDYDKEATGLDFWELQALTKNFPARRTVWLVDTCHSGGAAQNLTTVEISSRGVSAATGLAGPDAGVVSRAAARNEPGQAGSSSFVVITASRPDEVSWEDGQRGGLFTSRLADGLRAAAGKQLPLEDIFKRHVINQVVEGSRAICQRRNDCTAPQQTPVFAYSGRGNRLSL